MQGGMFAVFANWLHETAAFALATPLNQVSGRMQQWRLRREAVCPSQ